MAKKREKQYGSKTLACKTCNTKVTNVDIDAAQVMCWKCTYMYASGYTISELMEMTAEQHKNNRIFVKLK